MTKLEANHYDLKELGILVKQGHLPLLPSDGVYPIAYKNGDPPIKESLGLLADRAVDQSLYRQETYRLIKERFPYNKELLAAFQIFNRIAPFLDQIFIAQVTQYDTKPGLSWEEYAPVAVESLRNEVKQIFEDVDYKDFFKTHGPTQTILGTVANVLSIEKDPKKLRQLAIALETLAIASAENVKNKDNRPVFLFCMSDFYTNPNRSGKKFPDILEADLRLLIPYNGERKHQLDQMAEEAWGKLVDIYSQRGRFVRIPGRRPSYIFGVAIGFAGSEIWSYGSAEAFNRSGFYIAENMFKNEEEGRKSFELSATPVPENWLDYEVYRFIIHEMSHLFSKLKWTKLNEIAADMTELVVGGSLMLEKTADSPQFLQQLKLREYIASVVGSYAESALEPITGNSDLDDSYGISARYIILKLIEHRIIDLNGNGQDFTIPEEIVLRQRMISLFADINLDHSSIFHPYRHAEEVKRILTIGQRFDSDEKAAETARIILAPFTIEKLPLAI